MFDAPTSTAQGIRLLGERGQNMEEAARALLDVGTTLAQSTSRSRDRVRALEADLRHIAGLYAGAVTSIAGAPGAAATVATAEQRYQQMAVDAVRTAADHVQAEIDDYTAVLTNRGARLDSLDHAPVSPAGDVDTDVDDEGGPLSDLADFGADVGNAVASFGNAVLHNPEAAAGLILGIGAVLVGGSMATGGVAVSGTGVGAVAGVPAATAGTALVATGGALVVASAGELGAGAQGTDRVTPFEPRALDDSTSLRGASP